MHNGVLNDIFHLPDVIHGGTYEKNKSRICRVA